MSATTAQSTDSLASAPVWHCCSSWVLSAVCPSPSPPSWPPSWLSAAPVPPPPPPPKTWNSTSTSTPTRPSPPPPTARPRPPPRPPPRRSCTPDGSRSAPSLYLMAGHPPGRVARRDGALRSGGAPARGGSCALGCLPAGRRPAGSLGRLVAEEQVPVGRRHEDDRADEVARPGHQPVEQHVAPAEPGDAGEDRGGQEEHVGDDVVEAHRDERHDREEDGEHLAGQRLGGQRHPHRDRKSVV